ncbi:MAG TPA: phosphatase PAP2 family protein [Verrucomicrobiae bacterium]|nr:phosphatase PAP2 family protein [Verrucomicrobiae bacterium]
MRRLLALTIAFALTACATTPSVTGPIAEPRAYAPWTGFLDHPPGYLTRENAPNAARFVPGAPPAGSADEAADLAYHRNGRPASGGVEWLQAAADNEVETPRAPYIAFAAALGREIDPASAPTLTLLLASVLPDVEAVQHDVKRGAFRERPYLASGAAICIEAAPWLARSSSYPSGHAAIGWAWALILAELAPEHRDAILARGVAYGQSRAICGVHYPSDVRDGRLVGAALVAHLHADPAFRRDLEIARTELAIALAAD